jgi:hypothetical protein
MIVFNAERLLELINLSSDYVRTSRGICNHRDIGKITNLVITCEFTLTVYSEYIRLFRTQPLTIYRHKNHPRPVGLYFSSVCPLKDTICLSNRHIEGVCYFTVPLL